MDEESVLKWLETCSLDEKQRFFSIRILMNNHTNLLYWLFRIDKPEMIGDADSIRRQAGIFSSGEKVLISMACDIWFNESETPIADMIQKLDNCNYRNALWAINEWRAI